jgi:hypothetical protein
VCTFADLCPRGGRYFLSLGYAVIYVHRPGSIAPFGRHLQVMNRSSEPQNEDVAHV